MSKRFPFITAHSGSMNTIDHTLPSIMTALQIGADIVEEDIRITKDGVLVLAHDDLLMMNEGVECSVSGMNYDELSPFSFQGTHGAGSREFRICKLEDMLQLIRPTGQIANLDIKASECIAPVSALLRKLEMTEQAFLSGCGLELAMFVQQTDPELRKLLNVDTELFRSMPYEHAADQICRDALAAGCVGININYHFVREELLAYASSLQLPVYVWTVNEEDQMHKFIDWGVASITTRNLQALVDIKRRMLGALYD
ncbi:glycerophosphoryl diester phosphodiesterase [Paenibacillus taihuensis]|uniref:Glycerophosphoryl diester phosphodiesterase n=1 Tax=Paenibacillus taihuensis TaxID=1156355 RepID=A0A3D9SFI2_9BACL|nr:glycerophosphodiester phosphodiesterase [Paenibacillus taihuensis]REE87507.1 glycerophosphoryl diester phosphodiesterase [Paenibacillus taihuensis]